MYVKLLFYIHKKFLFCKYHGFKKTTTQNIVVSSYTLYKCIYIYYNLLVIYMYKV